jgi:hypothetical protein
MDEHGAASRAKQLASPQDAHRLGSDTVLARGMRATRLTLGVAAAALALTGCGGGKQFANNPRPPETLQLTGVITKDKVTISPNKVGAGPVIITVSNQTPEAHTLTLTGQGIEEQIGPINPLDTAQLQKTLKPGHYRVRAGTRVATAKSIAPATLVIGKERPSGAERVLLP